MAKKIFVLVGHPDAETMSGALAAAYVEGAKNAGYEVRRTNIGDLAFDPILHKGYKIIQPLEPDLLKAQEDIKWADHIVVIYPNWWGTMPALLKGFFDRAFVPGFSFKFHKVDFGWDGLLRGKSGRVVITMDTNPFHTRMLFGDFTNELRRAILMFCGVRPVRLTTIGPLPRMSDAKKKAIIEKIRTFGRKGI